MNEETRRAIARARMEWAAALIDEAWRDLQPTNSVALFYLSDVSGAIQRVIEELDAEPARLAALAALTIPPHMG